MIAQTLQNSGDHHSRADGLPSWQPTCQKGIEDVVSRRDKYFKGNRGWVCFLFYFLHRQPEAIEQLQFRRETVSVGQQCNRQAGDAEGKKGECLNKKEFFLIFQSKFYRDPLIGQER